MGDNSVSWDGRPASRWGHWGATCLLTAIGAAILLGLHPLPAGTPGAVLIPTLLFGVVIASWLAMRQHDRKLCEICAVAMPLNAAETASRYHRRFALAHASSNRRLIVGYLVILLGSNFFLIYGTEGRIAWAVVQSTMFYLVLAYSSHRKYQPWCPQCRGGGGGDDDRVQAPDPLPQGGQRA
jgi:hypothetical protein